MVIFEGGGGWGGGCKRSLVNVDMLRKVYMCARTQALVCVMRAYFKPCMSVIIVLQ